MWKTDYNRVTVSEAVMSELKINVLAVLAVCPGWPGNGASIGQAMLLP